MSICIIAGIWQIDRAQKKNQIFAAFEMSEDARTLRDLVDDQMAGDFRYRHFVVSGRYDGERQILLDNMILNGRVGYHVLTPFRIGSEAVVVNRG